MSDPADQQAAGPSTPRRSLSHEPAHSPPPLGAPSTPYYNPHPRYEDVEPGDPRVSAEERRRDFERIEREKLEREREHERRRHADEKLPLGEKDSFQASAAEATAEVGLTKGDKAAQKLSPESSPDSSRSADVIWVEFQENDPEDPYLWPKSKKWIVTILTVWFTGEVAFTASAFVPGIPSMERDLGNSHELSLLGVSLYALGFALPPLVLAPFSEAVGRNPVYLVTYFFYWLFFLPVALAKNITTVLVCRFIAGAFGSTGSTMVGGTIADIWKSHERGIPMAMFSTVAIVATGLGPACMGWVQQNSHLQWRWAQWLQLIYVGAIGILIAIFLRETRGSVILSRRAKKLRKETGDLRYRARADEERASLITLIRISCTRPMWLLFTEPIVTSFSLWISFAWGFMYLLLESIPLIFEGLHGFNSGTTGLAFLTLSVGAILGALSNPLQERMYIRNVGKRGPEARLYSAMVAAVLFPAGCFIYAWTSYSHISYWAPLVAVTVVMFAIWHIYLCVFIYLADSYMLYASSAIAAQSFLRNLFGAIFPLFATQMYVRLDYHWASTLCGFLAALLGIVPFLLFAFGPTIRSKSKFAKELARLQRIKEEEAVQQPLVSETETEGKRERADLEALTQKTGRTDVERQTRAGAANE